MARADRNGDKQISRREVLLLMRSDRKYADFLKLPPTIRQADGTFQKFIDFFVSLDTSLDGLIDADELTAHLGAADEAPADASNASNALDAPM